MKTIIIILYIVISILAIALFVLSLVGMIYSIRARNTSDNRGDLLSHILTNHRRKLSKDIAFDYYCQESDYFSPLIFPGTHSGCICRGEVARTCPEEEGNLCDDIKSINSANFNIWKGTHHLCFEREAESYMRYTYYELLESEYIFSSDKECPPSRKLCGVIDTLDNKLCIKENEECPINRVEIRSGTVSDSSSTGEKAIKMNNSNENKEVLVYSNSDPNGKIVVETVLTEGDVCANPEEFEGLEPIYPLIREMEGRVDKCLEMRDDTFTEDINYTGLDQYSKYYLYQEAGITEYLDMLPYYKFNQLRETSLKLRYRGFIGWKPECMVNSLTDPRQIFNLDSEDSNESKLKTIKIVSIIAFSFACFTLICSFYEFKIVAVIFAVITLGLSLTCAVMSSSLNNTTINSENYNCTDPITRQILRYYNDYDNHLDLIIAFHWASSILALLIPGLGVWNDLALK